MSLADDDVRRLAAALSPEDDALLDELAARIAAKLRAPKPPAKRAQRRVPSAKALEMMMARERRAGRVR